MVRSRSSPLPRNTISSTSTCGTSGGLLNTSLSRQEESPTHPAAGASSQTASHHRPDRQGRLPLGATARPGFVLTVSAPQIRQQSRPPPQQIRHVVVQELTQLPPHPRVLNLSPAVA